MAIEITGALPGFSFIGLDGQRKTPPVALSAKDNRYPRVALVVHTYGITTEEGCEWTEEWTVAEKTSGFRVPVHNISQGKTLVDYDDYMSRVSIDRFSSVIRKAKLQRKTMEVSI